MHNAVGPFALRPVSEFDIVHRIRLGDEADVRRRLRRGRKGGRNCVRVFVRCRNLFDLHGGQAGFWEAVDRAIDVCEEEGYYFSPVLIVDTRREVSPGQFEWVMTLDEIEAWVREWLRRYAHDSRIFWSLVNEPEQPWQGFSGPLDPFLLKMADVMTQALGHKDFVIGAAPDGDDLDASRETREQCVAISRRCNFPATHSSRKGHAYPEGADGRFRRWVDHLEAAYDIVKECHKVNPDAVFYQEESHGHASRKQVPLPNGRFYEREDDPEAALMAAVTAECAEQVYCYHYISTQDDGTPGLDLIGQVLAHFPAGWKYRNDSWTGAPSRGFSAPGEGKVRHYVRPDGREARTLAYARHGVPRFEWVNGFTAPVEIYRGTRVAVWKTTS